MTSIRQTHQLINSVEAAFDNLLSSDKEWKLTISLAVTCTTLTFWDTEPLWMELAEGAPVDLTSCPNASFASIGTFAIDMIDDCETRLRPSLCDTFDKRAEWVTDDEWLESFLFVAECCWWVRIVWCWGKAFMKLLFLSTRAH